MTTIDALSRTLLLMRGDLRTGVADGELAAALGSVRVAISAGADACATRSGQSALVATALTLARSGHDVHVECPDVALIGPQPPLRGHRLAAAITECGEDLLPGRRIASGIPAEATLGIVLGAGDVPCAARVLHLDADDWSVRMARTASAWSGGDWPPGAIAVAVLAGAEAFKEAMRALRSHARDPAFHDALFEATDEAAFHLAPRGTPRTTALPAFDFVSGGAIANAALFALMRLPGVTGQGRVLDDDRSALSNVNRNALLRRSRLEVHKVEDLASLASGLRLSPDPLRFEAGMATAPTVLVGVDDIPSRWAVHAGRPEWVGVGATERFSVLVSSHDPEQACSGCLHPVAAAPTTEPIPTAAFVSLLSGLLLVCRWQRALGGEDLAAGQQQFLNALRPESWRYGAMPVAANPACPVGCAASSRRPAA